MGSGFFRLLPFASVACVLLAPAGGAVAGPHDALITKHAAAHGVPESLVRRVIHIESKGNARVVSKGNYGLMQIRLGTAKSMGYRGDAAGLLDADTNMTYAVKYLASAYRAAGCNEQRAINYYQRGFYKRPTSKCAQPLRPATTQVAANTEPAQRPGAQRAAVGSDATPASADRLQPRVVQVQTITRPKTFTASTATAAAAAPAPVQVAAAPSAAKPAVVAPTPAPAAAAVQPAAPPVAAPAKVAAVAAATPAATRPAPAQVTPVVPQTVARAPEPEASPQSAPAVPVVYMELLPMPKPRPASAPKAVAKLDAAATDGAVTDAPASRSDAPAAAAAPDTQVARLDSAAVPLPQRRPEIEAAPERETKPARRAQPRHTRVSRKKPEESGLVTFLKKLTTPTPEKPSRRRASNPSASWLQGAR